MAWVLPPSRGNLPEYSTFYAIIWKEIKGLKELGQEKIQEVQGWKTCERALPLQTGGLYYVFQVFSPGKGVKGVDRQGKDRKFDQTGDKFELWRSFTLIGLSNCGAVAV